MDGHAHFARQLLAYEPVWTGNREAAKRRAPPGGRARSSKLPLSWLLRKLLPLACMIWVPSTRNCRVLPVACMRYVCQSLPRAQVPVVLATVASWSTPEGKANEPLGPLVVFQFPAGRLSSRGHLSVDATKVGA